MTRRWDTETFIALVASHAARIAARDKLGVLLEFGENWGSVIRVQFWAKAPERGMRATEHIRLDIEHESGSSAASLAVAGSRVVDELESAADRLAAVASAGDVPDGTEWLAIGAQRVFGGMGKLPPVEFIDHEAKTYKRVGEPVKPWPDVVFWTEGRRGVVTRRSDDA